MRKEFDLLVYIGRFQPLHKGHMSVINKALEISNTVLVLVGGCSSPRSIRNPFNYLEVLEMFEAAYPEHHDVEEMTKNWRLRIEGIDDHTYNDDRWLAAAHNIIADHIPSDVLNPRVGLIGHSKDNTSYYLKMFPGYESVEVPNFEGIDATSIREDLFSINQFFMQADSMADSVKDKMNEILLRGEWWPKLREEYKMIQEYKKSWESAPYPPTFVTTDAVVVQSGHILLVKRGHAPGIGQWALPGGFLNQKETLIDGCIRELREETRLKVPAPVLKGSIKNQRTFDDPNRSSRGRTITHAFHFELTPMESLPKVKGSDDAVDAQWVKLHDLRCDKMFEDHYDIISYFTGI
jgi:bifunctional NMN adenylyltransferase/nudix hydrolase